MNTLVDFLVLLVKRFVAPTPKFFKTLSAVSAAASVIVAAPAFLEAQHIQVPQVMAPYISWIVAAAGLGMTIAARFAVENPQDLTNK